MKKVKGFTLIELLVVMLILSIALSSAFYILFSGWKAWQNISQEIQAFQGGRMVMERIVREIKGAKEISPLSTELKLALNYNPNIISYDLKNGKVRRRKNLYSSYLTTPGMVNSLKFIYPNPQAVNISMTIGKRNFGLISEARVRN